MLAKGFIAPPFTSIALAGLGRLRVPGPSVADPSIPVFLIYSTQGLFQRGTVPVAFNPTAVEIKSFS
jgi:hypothetical protein